MTAPLSLTVNGAALIADPSGALIWPATGTMIVADLHLEKASSLARRGVLLPPYDTRATLARLAEAVARIRPARVICLGDSFHDPHGAQRLEAGDRARLARMMEGRCWVWVAGNHDPQPPGRFGGAGGEELVAEELVDGPLTFRHAARPSAGPGEVSGHYHPTARVKLRGRSVSGRCFVADTRRLILPAFGAYAGGLDVGAPALKALLAAPVEVALLAARRVWRVPAGALMPPPPTRDTAVGI